ncbi:DUF4083 family protein [Bacillus sp. FJAT-50079]|uniref:DUF4083 family protein n=1 Tax=Bacillus sp. FJAT-50079 TaxID=2833577 RepID=UPI001BCA49A5|nr:DUF4083 family protein [Bacillus sp. FJAT-50079]MBS4209935.1 DUF4083 family protein [Bacillus sp. FJAT-50079]
MVIIFFCHLVLCILSFVLFIRRLMLDSSAKKNQASEIERKLNRIIELLEKNERV